MNKFYIAGAAALMMLAGAACSGTDEKAEAAVPEVKKAAEDATFKAQTNIRYIDMDSILQAYTLAQEISAEGQKLMGEYQSLERQKQNELQNFGNSIQQKVNNNTYLSQESYQADVNDFNKRQNAAANVLGAKQNSINEQMERQQKRLTDSIESFIKDYNSTRHYDAILYREAGVYFNPALNITSEVIAGLNARYKAKAADAEQDKAKVKK